jgi:predicted RNase H-like HicB family nuclease
MPELDKNKYNRCNCEGDSNIRQAKGNSMTVKFILSEYVDKAMAEAMYDKLEDRSFVGKIPVCKGVIAFGSTLKECQNELRSTLEDWILLGLKLRHRMPVIDSIDLNQDPSLEPSDTL